MLKKIYFRYFVTFEYWFNYALNYNCDEEIRHPHTFAGLWGKEVRLTGPADYSSKQELAMEREAVSLQPSLLVQADMGMRKLHSL